MESEIIVEDWSPVGDMQAFVEKTDRTYFFYLWLNPESEEPELKSCWVCNRVKAAKDMKEAFVEEGREPTMPEEFVDHDIAGIELDDESLSIEWFEEGDAAALLSGDKIIAVIPGFSGYENFPGYSVYAKGISPFAWELKQAYKKFEEELNKSRKFWEFFDDEDYWGKVQDSHIAALEKFFGQHEKYYAIDNDTFPPKAIAQGRKDDKLYGITLGVSMIPMPRVEMTYQDKYLDYRRMELGFACDAEMEKYVEKLYSAMSFLASLPWQEQTFLGHGHTIPFNEIPGYDYLLFLNSRVLSDIPAPKYDDFMGDKINLLWLRLITKDEFQDIVNNGVDSFLKGKNLTNINENRYI